MAKVLIINESEQLMIVLRDSLMREGYFVFTAPDAEAGLAMFQIQKPELTLLSINVREKEEWSFLDRLRREDPYAAILILSSANSEEAEKKASSAACLGIVSKTLGLEAYLHDVRESVFRVLPLPKPNNSPKPIGRILVVDDDEAIRNVLQRFFRSKRLDVITASDGAQGLELVKKERPHVMLLDIDMPNMNGLEVLTRLRDIDKEIIVMMISGNDDLKVAQQTMKQGACDYIVKPFNLPYLETTVMAKVFAATS